MRNILKDLLSPKKVNLDYESLPSQISKKELSIFRGYRVHNKSKNVAGLVGNIKNGYVKIDKRLEVSGDVSQEKVEDYRISKGDVFDIIEDEGVKHKRFKLKG